MVKIIKLIETAFQNWLRGKDAGEPLVLRREICGEIVEQVVRHRDGHSLFPFSRVRAQVYAPDEGQAVRLAGSLQEKQELENEVRAALRRENSRFPSGLRVEVEIVRERSAHWRQRNFLLHYDGAGRSGQRDSAEGSGARLAVLKGAVRKRRYKLKKGRNFIGRMAEVLGEDGKPIRHNDVIFLDNKDKVNSSVSRLHACIEYDERTRGFIIRDTQSSRGTTILRDNERLEVVGSVGRPLRNEDVIYLGDAKIRFHTGGEEGRGDGARRQSKFD